LQNSAHVQTTGKMLSPHASWELYLSPPGVVAWVKRIVEQFIAPMAGQVPPIPEFPASPPIGISVGKVGPIGEVDVVWPGESLEALAEFIEKLKRM
jgi:hypothetical protein